MSLLSALAARVRDYAGPRPMPAVAASAVGMPTRVVEHDDERQISMPLRTFTRWHLSDLESAKLQADNGNLRMAGQLWRAMQGDGQIAGVLSTRTQGLVQLPMRFIGDEAIVRQCTADFVAMHPPAELAALDADGVGLRVGVAEYVQEEGAELPSLRRLDPEFLLYRWAEDRWYYQTRFGLERITPGDGRWVLHRPGGAVAPWSRGLWAPLGRAFIAKEHAYFYRENYSSKLANAARVAVSPPGATDVQRLGLFQRIAAWGVNTVFDLPIGWDVKLLESNGRGYEVFQATIDNANQEIIITIAGQTVTTDGGSGFSNSAVHASIRGDLIQADANALAATLNEQCLPVWAEERLGSALSAPVVEWDVTGSADLTKEAAAMVQAAQAAAAFNEILSEVGKRVDMVDIARRYGVGLEELPPSLDRAPTIALAPTDIARVVTVNEARASAGVGNLKAVDGQDDPDGSLTVEEFAAKKAAGAAAPSDELVPPASGVLPSGTSSDDEDAPEDDAAERLAHKMTELKAPSCGHGSSNRCRLCGVERDRDVVLNDAGEHEWVVAWRAIPKPKPANDTAAPPSLVPVSAGKVVA